MERLPYPIQPKVHADFRTEVSPADMELERRGFWNVVNADGGTGGRARLDGVQVAGKTGTAQAKYKGREDTISWFICWAPFDNPKYTVAVMAQGGNTAALLRAQSPRESWNARWLWTKGSSKRRSHGYLPRIRPIHSR